MAFPLSTGPSLETKDTTFDVLTGTTKFFRAADWNDMRSLVHAARDVLAGSPRGFLENRGSALTAVRVHTATGLVSGYRKTVASARVLVPGSTGTTFVWVRWNVGTAAAVIVTAATEPSPYATATRDMPLGKAVRTGGASSITHLRPDWILQHRVT